MNQPEQQYGGHDRETWHLLVSRRNELLAEHRTETMAYAHRLSAWMIAQLFVANAGGLTLNTEGASPIALSLFVVGLLAAMACSLAGWWQSHLVYDDFFDLSNPNAYLGVEHLPKSDEKRDATANRFFNLAVGSGVLSLIAFAAGALLRIWA